jgi:hypothetical protein
LVILSCQKCKKKDKNKKKGKKKEAYDTFQKKGRSSGPSGCGSGREQLLAFFPKATRNIKVSDHEPNVTAKEIARAKKRHDDSQLFKIVLVRGGILASREHLGGSNGDADIS